MTRRAWVLGLAGILSNASKSLAGSGLAPLDKDSFRAMVSAHRGKVLLVDFWATYCAPCREEFPKLVALQSKYRQKGFDLVTVSCDEPEQEADAADFVARQNAPLPHYVRRSKNDDEFINAIDPNWSGALPALFLFDRNGRNAGSFIGETNINDLDNRIRVLVAAS